MTPSASAWTAFPSILIFFDASVTSTSFPFDAALNVIDVELSILRHFVRLSPLYVFVPFLSARFPEIVKKLSAVV